MASLMDVFLAQEATPDVCQLICQAIDTHKERRDELYQRFTFNRFDVTIDFVNQVVQIEDDLTPDASGQAVVPLNEFVSRLSR